MKFFRKKQANLPRRRILDDERSTSKSTNVFKRNRTLTGTTSDRLISVTSTSSNDLESPRQHVHNMSIKRRKVSGILSVVVFAAFAIWLFISNFTAAVSVSLSDTDVSKSIEASRYQKVIQDYLNANPTNRLQPVLNELSLSKYVSAKLPEVEGIIQRGMSGIGKTDFVIKMRKPIAGWLIDDKQYYVDSTGISFEHNYYSSPSVQIVDNSGVSITTGSSSPAIASKRFLSFVGRVVSLSQASGYTVTRAVLPPDTTRQLEIYLKEYSFFIRLSIDRPAGEQIEDMGRAVKYITGIGQNVSYIDVRVSGKAFYR